MSFVTDIEQHLKAGARGFWVHTSEEPRVVQELMVYCESNRLLGLEWSFIRGLCVLGHPEMDAIFLPDSKDPLRDAIKHLVIHMPLEHQGDMPWMLVLPDAHLYIEKGGARLLKEYVLHVPNLKGSFVCVSPKKDMPIELERLFVNLPLKLPDAAELAAHIPYSGNAQDKKYLADAAIGLSIYETQINTKIATAAHGKDKENLPKIYQSLWDAKAKYLEHKGLVKVKMPKETWEDVGGLFHFKRHIEVVTSLLIERDSKIPPPDGFLLVGFTGTGKSLVSKALTAHLSAKSGRPWKYLEWNTGNIYRSYVGESEAATRELFNLTELHIPCVVYIDEISHQYSGHGLGGRSDGGVTDRMVGSTMTWLEERPPGILIMASTNEPDKLPPHMTRAGRLGSIWHIPLPKEDAATEIMRIHLKHFVPSLLDDCVDFSSLVESLSRRNFSGSEIRQVIVEAAQVAYPRPPTLDDLTKTAEQTIPAIVTRSEEYERITTWARKRAREA